VSPLTQVDLTPHWDREIPQQIETAGKQVNLLLILRLGPQGAESPAHAANSLASFQ
jgi:hypothetical protein